MKKPFLLIGGYDYYPSRKTQDWIGCFETEELAEVEKEKHKMLDWFVTVDLREWTE